MAKSKCFSAVGAGQVKALNSGIGSCIIHDCISIDKVPETSSGGMKYCWKCGLLQSS